MDLIGFAFAVLLIELTPGPNMGWLVALTLSEGRRSGIAAISGIALGLASNAALSALAASFILQQSAVLTRGLAVLGAAMMAYLAWQAWNGSGESSPDKMPFRAARRHALAGFTINLFNPKASLFFLTVMPQFVAGGRPTYAEGLTLAAISVAIATGIHFGLIFGAEKVRPVLMSDGRALTVRRFLAIGMLAVGVWFLARAFI